MMFGWSPQALQITHTQAAARTARESAQVSFLRLKENLDLSFWLAVGKKVNMATGLVCVWGACEERGATSYTQELEDPINSNT